MDKHDLCLTNNNFDVTQNHSIPVCSTEGDDNSKSPSQTISGGTGGERYNNEEKIRIIQLFAESSNACDVQRRFKKEFRRKPPSTKTVRALFKKFKETGSITRKPYSQRVKPKSNDQCVDRVKDFFKKNPEMSTRKAAKLLNLSRSTIAKIIQDLKGREGGQIKRNRIMKKYGIGAKKSGGSLTRSTSNSTILPPKTKTKMSDINNRSVLGSVMFCLEFAAQRHRNQRRNDSEGTPFINYPIGVANILVQEGGIEDLEIIEAAILQKTLEDSLNTLEDITSNFSSKVGAIVDELTAEKRYPNDQQRKFEVENASRKSYAAQLIGMADKIYELRECSKYLPQGWNEQMRYEYYIWVKQVVQHYYPANYAMASSLQTFFTERNI